MFAASAASLGLLAVLLVLLNIAAHWLFIRFDMTASRAYSLSPASKALVKQLDDPVVIKAYFTPDLPAPYSLFSRYVRDMLTEYRSASRGRVRFEFVPPAPLQAFTQQAADAGLSAIQFQEMGSNEFNVRQGFMGLVFFYRDKTEVLPVVKDIVGLEYEITSRLAKMTRKNKKVIGVLSGHGETRLSGPHAGLSQDLQQLYDFQDITLPLASTAPVHADLLLLAGPKQKYDDKSLWALDQWIMGGTPAIFLVDRKNLMTQQFMVFKQETGLEDLLARYGAKLGDRLVYDYQCQQLSFAQNIGGLQIPINIPYVYIPLVSRFDDNHPVMRGLQAFALPYPVDLQPSVLPGAGHFSALFMSSPKSWLLPENSYSVAPNPIPRPAKDDPQGPFVLGAVLDGPFTSYFQGKPVPVSSQTFVGVSPKMQLIVVGTSRLLDPNLPALPGTDALISNMLGYLAKDETLIGIKSKGEIFRPLKPVRPAAREAVKWISILGVAALPVGLGLVLWRRRQAWRQSIGRDFSAPAPSSGA